jgi:hypothetical protein
MGEEALCGTLCGTHCCTVFIHIFRILLIPGRYLVLHHLVLMHAGKVRSTLKHLEAP